MNGNRFDAAWSECLGRLMAYRPESAEILRARTESEHAARSAQALRHSGLFGFGTLVLGGLGGYAWLSGAEDLMNLAILVGLVTTVLALRALLDCQPAPRTKADWLCRPIARDVSATHVPGMLDDPEIGPVVDTWIQANGSLRHIELDLLLEVYPRWKDRAQHLDFSHA